jgi:penicillin-binding protein 2
VLLVFRLWQLQVVEGAQFERAAEVNRRRTLPTSPVRGHIYDRDGGILAENVASFSVLAMVDALPAEGSSRAHMLDLLCTLLECSGTLDVNPELLTPDEKSRLNSWLSDHMGMPLLEAETTLEEPMHPLSVTLHLDEQEAAWLRREVSETVGLTYTNVLEEVLRNNPVPSYLPVTLMENIPRDTALVLEEHHLDLPGLFVQAEPLRRYPTGALTSHIVGYIGRVSPQELAEFNPDPRSGEPVRYLSNDRIGKIGVESAYEDLLRGQLGIREIEVDAAGHLVGAPVEVQAPTPGYDIVLTLDTDLQEKATEILRNYIREAESTRPPYCRPVYSGVAVVIDPRNGHILAMVSLPAYDNNAFVQGMSSDEFSNLLGNPQHPLLNRAIGGEFPPGSTFKPFIAGAVLEEEVVTPETLIHARGILSIPNRYDETLPPTIFPCWLRSGHGKINVVEAIQHSCNVFFFTVTGGTPENEFEDGLGIDRLVRYAHAYGFGRSTELGLPGEEEGLIPTPLWKNETLDEPWVQGDLYNMAIGQGNILVTPLQLVNAIAATANGGTLYQPQLLLRVLDRQGEVLHEPEPRVLGMIPVSSENLALVREGMRRVVTHGRDDYARNHSNVAIAGKTGSAEFGPFLVEDTRQTHAWFVAFAPYEDPQIAVAVMVEGGGRGSQIGMPAVTDIIDYYLNRPPTLGEESHGGND